jgi:hypothetical protein
MAALTNDPSSVSSSQFCHRTIQIARGYPDFSGKNQHRLTGLLTHCPVEPFAQRSELRGWAPRS